jgi:hypothetical protein
MFLGLFGNSKTPTKDQYIELERRRKQAQIEKMLREREDSKVKSANQKERKSIKDRVSGTVHTLKVKSEARKLKQFKKHKERQERKAANSAKIKSDSEKEAFGGKELNPSERAEYEDYRAERRRVKAERRAKLKEGLSKASSGFDGLSAAFDGAAQESPFDFNVADDKRQYGKKAGAIHSDGLSMFELRAPKSSKSKSSNLESMFAIGKGADLSMFVIKSPPARGKRTRKGDPLDLFSMAPQRKGRRKRTDFGGWF